MTESFLKPNWLVVQTLCPVHIGSGDKLGKTDIILQDGSVYVIDENKLFSWILSQPDGERLALELADDICNPNRGIDKFIENRFNGKLSQIIAYKLPYQGSPKDVLSFIKTTDRRPYIPGSTIKGVLRSGLLRGRMLGDLNLQEKAKEAINREINKSKPKTNSNEIEANLFVNDIMKPSKWPNYDINRLLVVRDSDGLPINSLEIIPIKTLSIQRNGDLSPKNFDIYVEALGKNQLIQIPIIWQTNLLSKHAQTLGFQQKEELLIFLSDYCRRVSHDLLLQEKKFYTEHFRKDMADWFEKRLTLLTKSDEDVFILPMGWGSGYDAKTITDLLGGETFEKVVKTYNNTQGLGKPGRNKNAPWLGPDDSPKSRKVVERDNGAEPIGWVACRFLPDDEENWLAQRRKILKQQKPLPIVLITKPASNQTTQPVSDSSTKPASLSSSVVKPLTGSFHSVPQIGDRFEGTVIETGEEILIEIPGLEDSENYAVINLRGLPIKRPRVGEKVLCEVIVIKPEKDYWRVECKLG